MFMVRGRGQAVGWWWQCWPRGDRAPRDLWDSSWCPHLVLFLTFLLHLLSVSFTRQRLPGRYFQAFHHGQDFHPAAPPIPNSPGLWSKPTL